MRTLNCKGNLIDLSIPKVMGIINTTPDSFYDGGKTTTEAAVLSKVESMLSQGATFLDIGGYSSRPGAEEVSEEEELQRVLPAIEGICSRFPEAIVSIDTFRSKVASKAIDAGAAMVNDISGGMLDTHMVTAVASAQVPYILMHMKGTPQTMSQLSTYNAITKEVLFYFSERIAEARKAGINDVIVDPGFGFAKTKEQSFQLLNDLDLFAQLSVPYLVGISRKSMIYKTLELAADEALNGTTALNTIALMKGASILRVHDVKEAMECVQLVENLKNANG